MHIQKYWYFKLHIKIRSINNIALQPLLLFAILCSKVNSELKIFWTDSSGYQSIQAAVPTQAMPFCQSHLIWKTTCLA